MTTSNVISLPHVLATLALHGDAARLDSLLARIPSASSASASLSHFDHATDALGRTPLHYAVENEAASRSLAARFPAWLHVLDYAGWSPLHYAVRRGRFDVARVLLLAGASPLVAVAERDARTPIHLAADSAHVAMLQLLLDAGAFVGSLDANGGTPLHHVAVARSASDAQLRESVALLVERLANVDARDTNGETALHWAAREAVPGAVAALLDHGADACALSADFEAPAAIASVASRSAAANGDQGEVARAARCEQALVVAVALRAGGKKGDIAVSNAPALGGGGGVPVYTFV